MLTRRAEASISSMMSNLFTNTVYSRRYGAISLKTCTRYDRQRDAALPLDSINGRQRGRVSLVWCGALGRRAGLSNVHVREGVPRRVEHGRKVLVQREDRGHAVEDELRVGRCHQCLAKAMIQRDTKLAHTRSDNPHSMKHTHTWHTKFNTQ